MELGTCPYCESQGLVLSVKPAPGGLEVNGHCLTCGYSCDSDYASDDIPDDLPCEFEPAVSEDYRPRY